MELIYDTEGDNLYFLTTTLWCIVAKDINTGHVYQFEPHQIEQGLSFLKKADKLICHNQIDHDLPVMKKLYGWEPSENTEIVDTLVISRAIWPDREAHPSYHGPAPHSVEAYGVKFGIKKPEHEDWSQYSEEMLHRCTEDVHIQHEIYNYLLWEAKKERFPAFSWKLEHYVASLISQQEKTGIPFDKDKALHYLSVINQSQNDLFKRVRPFLGMGLDRHSDEKEVEKRRVAKPFSRDGSFSKKLEKLFGNEPMDPEEVAGPFTFVDINLSSRQTVINSLLDLGWTPKDNEWNLKKDKKGKPIKDGNGKHIRTSPKLTDKGKPVESLFELQSEVGKDLARWYVLGHRRGQIQGWVNRCRKDGRLSAGANPCGANTSRMKHKVVVNVPQAETNKEGNLIWDVEEQSTVFGTQMRSLFCTIPGYTMVGYDASGLEARMLAHYLGDPDLVHEILHGDFHTFIWNFIPDFVHSRSNTKNIEYALIYGAQDPKLGGMVDDKQGLTQKQAGAEVRKRLMKGIPALGDLTERTQRQAEKGYVTAIDGRRLYVRSPHSALNTRLQGSGSIVMKTSAVYLDKWAKRERIEHEKVLDMHDEAQHLVIPDQAELFGSLAVKAIQQSGRYFKTKCPMDGEYKIGSNWAETH